MTRDGSLGDLLIQAKITNRLLAAFLKGKMSQTDLILLLSTTGATGTEIAAILNTTPATVKVTLHRIRRGR